MRNAFHRLISRPDTTEDKISELDNKETLEVNRNFQNGKIKRKTLKNKTKQYPRNVEQLQKVKHE